MKRQKKEPESLPDRIVRAALELFEELPKSEVTYRKIAARAGVSHMAPYRYFKTIEDILFRISEDADRQWRGMIQATIEEFPLDPERQICEVGVRYFGFALGNRVLFSIMTNEHFSAHPELAKKVLKQRRETLGVVMQIVRNCQLSGVLPVKANCERQAFTLWSFVHGLTFLFIQNQSQILKSPIDPKRAIVDGIKVLLKGMRTETR